MSPRCNPCVDTPKHSSTHIKNIVISRPLTQHLTFTMTFILFTIIVTCAKQAPLVPPATVEDRKTNQWGTPRLQQSIPLIVCAHSNSLIMHPSSHRTNPACYPVTRPAKWILEETVERRHLRSFMGVRKHNLVQNLLSCSGVTTSPEPHFDAQNNG